MIVGDGVLDVPPVPEGLPCVSGSHVGDGVLDVPQNERVKRDSSPFTLSFYRLSVQHRFRQTIPLVTERVGEGLAPSRQHKELS